MFCLFNNAWISFQLCPSINCALRLLITSELLNLNGGVPLNITVLSNIIFPSREASEFWESLKTKITII